MSILETRVPPPLVLLVVAAAMWGLARIPAGNVEIPGRVLIVVVMTAMGGWLAIAGILEFRRHQTTIHPFNPEETSAIVSSGVYRVSRNPMYLGLAIILLAWAVYLGNAWTLLGIPLFIAYLTRFQIIPEERALRQKFGDEYASYSAAVRRWI